MFTKKDFNDQILRIIITFELFFKNVSNVEFQRTFCCLNNIITFSLFFIIKNHLFLRAQKIQFILLQTFYEKIKMFLFMNCCSFFNRQEYLIVLTYFIDENECYHEVVLTFNHITNFHTRTKLVKIMQDIIARHKLKERTYVITRVLIYWHPYGYVDISSGYVDTR
jgi:hypothetical protein